MSKKRPIKICKVCNKKFEQKRKDQIYCSRDCRFDLWLKNNPRVNLSKLPKDISETIKAALGV